MKFGGWALQCIRGIGRKGCSPCCTALSPPQPVCLLPPSFTSGPCSLARLPVTPHAVRCYRYWFKWPDSVSLLCTDPPTDWFSDRSTKDWQWSNGGLEVVLMGTIYLNCKYHSLTGQVPPLPPPLITPSHTTVGLVWVMATCHVIGGVEQSVG